MSWQLLEIHADNEQAVLLSEIFLAHNALSVSIEDAGTGKKNAAVFAEWGEPVSPLWPTCWLQVLFAKECDLPQLINQVRDALGWPSFPAYTIVTVSDKDWVRSFQKELRPMAITETLWIVPNGQTPPQPAAVNIYIDPGLAFWSGTHPTTRLCLQWLERNIRGGEVVVDYGCGSGMLAIAAFKLGAKRAVGIDVDPQG